MTPLFRRVLTAVAMLGVFVSAVLWAPGWLWAALMAVVAGLAAYEWARLSDFPPLSARVYAALLALSALALPYVLAEKWPAFSGGTHRAGNGVLAGSCPAVVAQPVACAAGVCARPGRRRTDRADLGGTPVFACARPRCIAGRVGDCLDCRYRSLFCRASFWTSQARTHNQPRKNLGRRCGCMGRARAVCRCIESMGRDSLIVIGSYSVGIALSVGVGRFVRVMDQARFRHERQREHAAWTWRCA